ncbi:MAG TPA: hypothetical protein VGM92_09540 [Candidatus Kapabacteria bacterium]
MTKYFILAFAVAFVACSKSTPPPGPTDAVMATYKALEAQDSAAFIQTLSQDKCDAYSMNPSKVTEILGNWKGNHADVKVLSVVQNDTAATVLYNLNVTGTHPHSRDSILARLYMENGTWKHGY